MRKVKVAVTQMACSREHPDNIEKAESIVREASNRGANIILLHQVLFDSSIPCCTFFYPFGISVWLKIHHSTLSHLWGPLYSTKINWNKYVAPIVLFPPYTGLNKSQFQRWSTIELLSRFHRNSQVFLRYFQKVLFHNLSYGVITIKLVLQNN